MHSFEIVEDVMPTIGLYAIGMQPCCLSTTSRSWPSWLLRHAWVNYRPRGRCHPDGRGNLLTEGNGNPKGYIYAELG